MPVTPAAPPIAASSSPSSPRDAMLYLIWELRSLIALVLVFGVAVGFTTQRMRR